MRWLVRWLLRAAVFVAIGLGIAVIAPIVWVETACVAPRAPAVAVREPILAPAYRRNPVDSLLSYPEWSIVHAYEDFAAVARTRGESAFAYAASMSGYWSSLCRVMHTASARGGISTDMRSTLYVIGVSFSAEIAVKGAWERSVGALTAAWRGEVPTAADRFAHAVADDYAVFLRQTPWFLYPFGATLKRFWHEVPWRDELSLRGLERHVALSLEYGVKALYAKGIGALAGLAPTVDTRIRSVVRGLDPSDLSADPRIVPIERRADGTTVIETPRYRAFTEIVAGLAERGRDLVEIAGNDTILVTLVGPRDTPLPARGAGVFAVPIQAKPGAVRIGVELPVDALCETMRALRGGATVFEHAYDY